MAGDAQAAPWLTPVRRIFVAAFGMDLAIAVVGLSVQFSGHELHATPMMLGLLATASATAYTVFCLFTGRLSDVWGRRVFVVLSCLVCAGAWVAMTRATRPWHLLALTPISGAGVALFWPPMQAWLAELTSGGRKGLVTDIGAFNIAWTVGLMLGPPLAGLVWAFGRPAPFFLSATMILVLLAFLLTIPKGRPQSAPHDVPEESPSADDQVAGQYLTLARIANFGSWFGRGLTCVVFPKLGKELGLSEAVIGIVVATFLTGQLAMFAFLRRRTSWQYRLWPLLAAEMVGCLGMMIAFVASTPSIFGVGFALAGACAGVTYVASLFYSLHGDTAGRGARTGVHEAVLGTGVVLGPLCGGLVANYVDLRAPFALVAAVFCLIAAANVLVWRRTIWPVRLRQRAAGQAEVARK